MKLTELKPEFVEFIPTEKKPGILYVSETYGSSSHLCPCGCNELVVIPFATKRDEMNWAYRNDNGAVSFDPSIGNNQLPCKSHYYITGNKIRWA